MNSQAVISEFEKATYRKVTWRMSPAAAFLISAALVFVVMNKEMSI